MIKGYYPILKDLVLVLLLLTSYNAFATPPQWTNNYPQAINGATSIDFTFNVDQNSTVYYVIYSTSLSAITPASVKTDAKASVGGNIIKNGIVTVKSLTDTKAYVTGLQDGKTYYAYIIAENSNGEIQAAANVKSYTLNLPVRQSPNSYKSSFTSAGGIIGYLAYFPEAYYKNPSSNYPVMIFLHGSGEKTYMTDNISLLDKVKANGPPKLIDQGQEFPFIVISPQCPFSDWDNVGTTFEPGAFVNEIVEMVKSNYRVDLNRMYMTGLSMGGGGTFSYIQNYPGKMAAAIPIAGWGDPNNGCSVTDIGLWAFQGELDDSQGIIKVINAVNDCKKAGQEQAKVTVYAGGGHDAWSATYTNTGAGIAPDNIYDWLLRHSRNAPANQNPVVNAGTDITGTLPLTSVILTGGAKDSDGSIVSYTWSQIAGTALTISGGTTANATLSGLIAGSFTFRLTAKDNAGGTSYDDVVVKINPAAVANKLPVATAGADKSITLPVNTSSFLGTATDADGTIASYVWAQISGPSATITGANTATLTLSNLLAGSYTFRLTATDNQGGSSSDDVTLTVVPALASTSSTATLSISSLVLCDANKSAELVVLSNGFKLDLAAYPTVKTYTVLVKTPSSDIGSIVFTLDGSIYRTENKAPFVLTGNCYAGYNCFGAYWSPAIGSHTIIATPYSGAGGTGTKGSPVSITFTVLNSAPATVLSSGTLVLSQLVLANADKDVEISTLVDGSTLNLSSLGGKDYTVLAKPGSTDIGSVVFTLDGSLFRIEDKAPFSMTGNCSPGYNCYGAYWQPGIGSHTVTATAYSQAGGTGTKGTSLTSKFNVISSSSRLSADETTSSLEVSPNPFINTLNISFAASSDETAQISIIDAQGLSVYNSVSDGGNENNYLIDLSDRNLKSGLYIVQLIKSNGEKRSAKIMKQ